MPKLVIGAVILYCGFVALLYVAQRRLQYFPERRNRSARCADQDALAAAFFAAVVIGARPEQIASYGCRMIPKDAQVEILQRFPSGFQFLRLVKVNVTSPSQPVSTVGYTFEISR